MNAAYYPARLATVLAVFTFLSSAAAEEPAATPKPPPDGVKQTFDKNGKLVAEDTYLNGVLHGPSKKWDGRGTLLQEGSYKNGKMDGLWRELRGQEWIAEKNYREGVLHGPYRTRFLTRMSTDGQYVEGERDGEWVKTSYYNNKVNTVTQHFRRGVREGKWVYTSSKLAEPIQITFKDGLLVDSPAELKNLPLLKRIEALSRPDMPRDPFTERIADALFEQTDLIAYAETPLGEVTEDLGERFRLAVSPDRFALERNKITLKAPVTISNFGVPLILGLARIAKHQGLTLDYRYHSIWLTRQDFAENWQDTTGALSLVPTKGSKLEKAFSWKPSPDPVPRPSRPADLFLTLEKDHGVKIEFLDDATRAKFTDNAREVGKFRTQHTIRDLLAAALYQSGCACTEKNGALVIVPQTPVQ